MSEGSSPKQEILVLVDDKDNELGKETREKCHAGRGIRHRAYVVFLFHEGRLLLQQRSQKKQLWSGFWDVSYTSHVYPGETYQQAAERKSVQEIGAKVGKLEDAYSFVYWVPHGANSENEFCRLLVGEFDGKVKPNPDEVSAVRWTTVKELEAAMRAHPERYTPWLKLAFDGFLKNKMSEEYRRE